MSRSIARARAGRDRASLYQEITDKIIAELEAGRVPWVQPWGTAAAKASLNMPKNAATHRHYSGINVLRHSIRRSMGGAILIEADVFSTAKSTNSST
jgi:antirestriction protein ArdC